MGGFLEDPWGPASLRKQARAEISREGVINEGRNQNIQNRQAWGKMQFWEGHRKNQYTGAIGPEEGGELDKNRIKIKVA